MPSFIERVKERIKDPSRDFKERVFIVLNIIIDSLIIFAFSLSILILNSFVNEIYSG